MFLQLIPDQYGLTEIPTLLFFKDGNLVRYFNKTRVLRT